MTPPTLTGRPCCAGTPPPAPTPADKRRTAELLRTLPPPRPTGLAFVWCKAGFIRKRMWALQFALLAGGAAAGLGQRPRRGSTPCGSTPSVPRRRRCCWWPMCRTWPGSTTRVCWNWNWPPATALPRVTAARLLVFGVCDAVLLAVFSAAGSADCRSDSTIVLLYCLTPFCCVSAVCMGPLRRLRPAAFTPAALAVTGIALLVLVTARPPAAGPPLRPPMPGPSGRRCWCCRWWRWPARPAALPGRAAAPCSLYKERKLPCAPYRPNI